VDTGCTRVEYDHDYDDDGGGLSSTTTTQTSTTTPALTPTLDRRDGRRAMARWRLDHILYTPSTLAPKGEVGHAGGRQTLVLGRPAERSHSHRPPVDSGIVRNVRPSPIVRRVEEEVHRKVERDRGQALG
jgi:hypothetical protein